MAEKTVWNRIGKPVHMMTRTKMSQTLLVSQTGSMAWSMSHLGRLPRAAPPATRSQNPAP